MEQLNKYSSLDNDKDIEKIIKKKKLNEKSFNIDSHICLL